MDTSEVGVVIATRNRSDDLCVTLDKLQELPERPPVVVVDNGSTDGSPGIVARRFPDVTVIELGRNLGAAARTTGVEAIDTPLVAFCDDDSWWAPGSLDKAGELFRTHAKLALVAAKVLVGDRQSVDPVCELMATSPLGIPPDLPGPRILGFIACGAVVRRGAYLQAGGFDVHFGVGGEEEHLALSMAALGWELAYVDSLVAHHHPSPIRDRNRRREVVTRNSLWTAWLLRSRRQAASTTLAAVAGGVTDPGIRRGVVSAIRGLPWIVPRRRPVPHRVEEMARAVDAGRSG